MQPFDFDLHLPDAGVDIHVEFTACFDHAAREWEPAEDITIEFADAGLADLEKFAIHDLDQSSRLMVEGRITALLEERTPTESESERIIADERGDRQYREWAEAQL